MAALCVVGLSFGPAFAATPRPAGDILWLLDDPAASSGAEVLAGIGEALAAERSGHLLGEAALLERVGSSTRPFSGCAFGIDRCGAPEAMAFDALGLGLLVRLHVQRRSDTFEINYEMVDRRGTSVSTGRVSGQTPRQAGFELVRELFDAVGVVSFESEPPGATVFVDGEELGATPLSRQYGVGSYSYRLVLDTYTQSTGDFEVRAGLAHRVEAALERLPGQLRISGAPENAVVFIDDAELGRAQELLEIEAGRYALEVRAEGYETHRSAVVIEAEAVTDLEVQLLPMRTLLRDISAQAIADHRYQFVAGLEVGMQMGTFHNARGRLDGGTEYGFEGFVSQGELVDDGELRRFLMPRGVQLGAAYEGEYFGLTYLSLSFVRQAMNHNARLRTRGGDLLDGRVTARRNLQLRPLQLRARFFYENLAPTAQLGLGVSFQSMDFAVDDEHALRLRQVEAFTNLELGLRYHFDPAWSLHAGYRLQHYFAPGLGAEHSFGIGVGFGVRELPGLVPQPPGEL